MIALLRILMTTSRASRLLVSASMFIGFLLGIPIQNVFALAGDLDPLDVSISGGAILTTVVQPDGKILVGGTFTSVLGVARNRIARLNSDGTLDGGFDPNANGTVESIVVLSDGRVLLGGFFTTLQPDAAGPVITRNRIARVNVDGSVDPGFNPNANQEVLSIAGQADGKIVIVGRFTSLQPNGAAAASTRTKIARLNADGTLDSGFAPTVSGDIYSLAIQADGKIVIVGNFTGVASSSRTRIARLNANGTLDTGFNLYADNSINSIAIQPDGRILIGGDFSFLGSGTSRNRIARLNVNGTVDTSFSPYANDKVYSMAVQANGQILIAGYFTTLRPTGASTFTTRNRIARLNANGTLDMAFDPNAGGAVNSVALQADGRILLGGPITTLQPNGSGTTAPRAGFARLYNDPATETLTVPMANQIAWKRGGSSPEFGRVIFEVSVDSGSTWTLLGPGVRTALSSNWQINDLSLPSSGWIRASGVTSDGNGSTGGLIGSVVTFSNLTPLPEVAVFNGTSTAYADERLSNTGTQLFATTAIGAVSAAQTFTVRNTGLADLTGLSLSVSGANPGDFIPGPLAPTLAPGATATFTVNFYPSIVGVRSAVLNLGSNDADENPYTINLQGTGLPSKIATLSSLSLSAGILTPAFDPATTSYSADLPHPVSSITVTPVKSEINAGIAVRLNGGSYTAVMSGSASGPLTLNAGPNTIDVRVTAQDGTTIKTYTVTVTRAGAFQGSLDPLDPNVAGTVFASAVQPDGKILLVGNFVSVGGVSRNSVARLNLDGTLDMEFNPNANQLVFNVAIQQDGKILLCGLFTSLHPDGTASPVTRNHVARLNPDGTVDAGFDPKPNGDVHCVVLQPDGKVLIGGDFTTLQPNGAASADTRSRIARMHPDGSLDAGFDPNADGVVYTAAVQSDGRVLLGGLFTTLQPNGAASATTRNGVARVNSNGTLDNGFDPNANGVVNCLAVQPDGRVLLGGDFTTLQPNGAASATTRNRIARLTSNGTLDNGFDPNANNSVYSIVVQTDGRVLLGGSFTTLQTNGAPAAIERNRIARLDPEGMLDIDFDPSAGSYVFGLALQADGKVLVSGSFYSLSPNGSSGAYRNGLARLFNDAASQNLTIPDASRIEWLRGGSSPELEQVTFDFSADNGAGYTRLGEGIRINGGWQLTGLSLPSGLIRARGRTAGGRNNGSSGMVQTLTAFGVPASPEIAVSGNDIDISNEDSSPNPADRTDFGEVAVFGSGSAVVRRFTISNTGAADLTLGNVTLSGAHAADFQVSQQPSSTVAPGQSTTMSITFDPSEVGLRGAVVALNNNDTDETPFQFSVQGTGFISSNANLSALSLSIGNLSPVFSFAVLNYTSGVVNGDPSITVTPTQENANASIQVRLNHGSFTAVASGSASGVLNLNVGANTVEVYVTAQDGVTTKTYTVTVTRAAPGPGDLDPLVSDVGGSSNDSVSSFVEAIAIQPDGKTIIAGNFTTIQGAPRNNIARLNADGSLDTGFDPKANNYVLTVAVQSDGKILLGGWFTTLQPNGVAVPVTRNRIARLNADGSLDAGFDPNASSYIRCIAVQPDGKILLGGYFTTLQPNAAPLATSRNRIARLNPDGTLDAGFNPSANAYVNSMALQADGKVLLGGGFTALQPNGSVIATTRNRIARLNSDGTLDTGFNPNANDTITSVVVQADGKVLFGGNFSSIQPTGSVQAVARGSIARVNADGSLDADFNPNFFNVQAIALQADRMILVGGTRLADSGAVDTYFRPLPNGNVNSVALQADGRVMLGGNFTALQPNGATPLTYRYRLARILNSPATQSLSAPDATSVNWTRGGSSPEISYASIELSTDGGGSYTPLGNATRVGETANWRLSGLNLPTGGIIRARGRTAGEGSGLVETVAVFGSSIIPVHVWRQLHFGLSANTGNGADHFDFDHDGLVNLIEYAFGLNPTIPDAHLLPEAQRAAGNFSCAFTQPSGVVGITYGAEWSDDLVTWNPVTDAGVSPQHVFSVPMAGKTSLFLRLTAAAP